VSLRDAWDLRNAAATSLVKTEEHVRRVLSTASASDIVELLDTFSPARSPGPEWTRSFDPLIERLWAWCDPSALASVKAEFDRRGSAWAAIANALAPEEGERVRALLGRPSVNRLPRFTLA
jgi:hypothetical protein